MALENHPFIRGNIPGDRKSKKRNKRRDIEIECKNNDSNNNDNNAHHQQQQQRMYTTNNWGGDKHIEHNRKGRKDRDRDRDRRNKDQTNIKPILSSKNNKNNNNLKNNKNMNVHPISNSAIISRTRHSLPILKKNNNDNNNNKNNQVKVIEADMNIDSNNNTNTKSNKNNTVNTNKHISCFPGISTQNSPPPQNPNYQQVDNIFSFYNWL